MSLSYILFYILCFEVLEQAADIKAVVSVSSSCSEGPLSVACYELVVRFEAYELFLSHFRQS